MQCAKCKAEMRQVQVESPTGESVEVDRCGTCGGLWFDLREHEKLLKAKGMDADLLDSGHPLTGERYNEQRDIDCPRCNTKMVKLAHHHQRQIEYEQCSRCGGIHLDAGEYSDLREKTISEKLRQMFPRLFGAGD